MADVETTQDLLIMALQDLYDGEAALVERLDAVRDAADAEAFKKFIDDDCQRSARQRDRVGDIARSLKADPEDAENIWLRAILDDADNDAEAIARGPLRDVALVGALRKGKQSERVSYETALALAERLERTADAAALRAIRDEEQEADDALAALLPRLVKARPKTET